MIRNADNPDKTSDTASGIRALRVRFRNVRLATLRRLVLLCLVGACSAGAMSAEQRTVTVGSKNFTESYVLAELTAQQLEAAGFEVERRFGLGGTLICYEALKTGEIDVYVEYTGTLAQAILNMGGSPSVAEVRAGLSGSGLTVLAPLGFDNTYALALSGELAQRVGLQRISQLAEPDGPAAGLSLAFSHEFMERDDGWPGLARAYQLEGSPTGLEHGLAYQAIADGSIDITDAYSTDGDLERYGLVVLADDRGFFPEYLALPLIRTDLPEAAQVAILALAGRLDATTMRKMNGEVVIADRTFAAVAREFRDQQSLLLDNEREVAHEVADKNSNGAGQQELGQSWLPDEGLVASLVANTLRHLQLTAIALGFAVFTGLPLGILVFRSASASRVVLYVAGLLQTVPSIALLALMIPLFGIGVLPAIVALFLYSLLPILRNTITAMATVDPLLQKVAAAMGLHWQQQIRYLLLPLAMPNVLAGLKTAAVISIGTATLAAFIGAGGLGTPMVTGLALNDTGLILQGAIPAALLAIVTELAFEALERRLIPQHMRRAPGVS